MQWSLRLKLLLPLVAVCVPFLLLTIVLIRWDQRVRQQETAEHVQAVSSTATIVLANALAAGKDMLDSLDGHPRIRAGGSECESFLEEIRLAGTRYASIGVAGRDGAIHCSSPRSGAGGTNIADRSYFQRAIESHQFSVGEFQTGRLSGLATVGFARPSFILDTDRVLFASIDLNWLATLLQPLAEQQGAVLVLTDRAGNTLIATGGLPDSARDELARGALTASAASVKVASAADEEFIVGVSPFVLRGEPVGSMVAAVPRAPLVADAGRLIWIALGVVAVTALVGLAGASVLSQRLVLAPIRRLGLAAERARTGDLDIQVFHGRTDEIGDLERAFDEAAGSLATSREALASLALVDHLTGVATRQGLEMEATRLQQEGHPYALIYLAIVGFHEITTTFGYGAADDLLRLVSSRLSAFPDLTVGRLGGNAFACVARLPEDDPERAVRALGTSILAALAEPFLVRELPLQANLLVGASIHPLHGTDFELLLRRADAAARTARPDVASILYTAERHEPRVNNVAVLVALQDALDRDELELHYQPVVDLQTGRTAKVEALLRWPRGNEAVRSPAVFVPLAERAGIIKVLDHWVVRHAVHQAALWGPDRAPHIAVNVSAASLQDTAFPAFVAAQLREYAVPGSALSVEITETALLTYFDDALDVCRRLTSMGLFLSIDDFGIGHSPILYLRDFPVSEIKIDRSLVAAAVNDNGVAAIIGALVAMADALGVRTVAEGVETAEQRELVAALGCEVAQGYLFAPALAAEEIPGWSSSAHSHGE